MGKVRIEYKSCRVYCVLCAVCNVFASMKCACVGKAYEVFHSVVLEELIDGYNVELITEV